MGGCKCNVCVCVCVLVDVWKILDGLSPGEVVLAGARCFQY